VCVCVCVCVCARARVSVCVSACVCMQCIHVRVWLCVSMASSVDSRPYHQDHTSRIMRGKSNHKGENLEMYGNYHNLFVVDAIHKYL